MTFPQVSVLSPMRPLIGQLSANQQETGRKELGDPWTVIGSSPSEKSRKSKIDTVDKERDRYFMS